MDSVITANVTITYIRGNSLRISKDLVNRNAQLAGRFTGIWWHRSCSPRTVCETVSLGRSTSIFVKPENAADIIIKHRTDSFYASWPRPVPIYGCYAWSRVSEGKEKKGRKIESRAIRSRGGHPAPSKVRGFWRNEYSILSMNGSTRSIFHANYSTICKLFIFILELS